MKAKRAKKSVDKLWVKNMHRVVYDLLTGCATGMHTLYETLGTLADTISCQLERDHRSKAAISAVTDLNTAARTGLRLGWEFGVTGQPLQITTRWTHQNGRRLAAVVRHAARIGHAIGLRQRHAVAAKHHALESVSRQ